MTGGARAFVDAICDPRRIEAQLRRLAARARGPRLARLVQDGLRLQRMVEEAGRTSALVARALADGSFAPGTVTLRTAHIGTRERRLAALPPLDLVVHGVIADVLAERLEPRLSPHLFSYRRGRSSWTALRMLARGVTRHRRQHAQPAARGLFVLRADVQDFTDSWPIDDGAPLWPELRRLTGLPEDGAHWHMLRRLLVPEIVSPASPAAAGATAAPPGERRGVLFGAPTTNVLANFYLASLDEQLTAVPDLLYARFGDDIFCAHPDLGVLRAAEATLLRTLTARGLRLNQGKVRRLFWNGAGRRSPAAPEIPGTTQVAFLGGTLRFSGGVGLSPRKWSALLADLRGRVRRTARLMPGAGAGEVAQALVGVVNQSLSLHSPLATDYAPLLADLVSDRHQLKQLDGLLALWVAEAATRRRGVRALRDLPWRRLRELGLRSLVQERNR
ncbi:MAG TPA: reverse transcriptase domain-containing protein [Polyangia bacterium]|nr:reverse transcriptase domain-containing protein [Polyangia bacterium]